MALGGEAGDVTGLDQQPRSAGRPDAVQAEQPGAGGLDQLGEFFVGCLLPRIDAFEIGDQLQGDTLADLPRGVLGPDRGEQLAGLGSGQILLRPPRKQSSRI